MISKSQLKFINSLSQKKYRKKFQVFLAEGAKIAEEMLDSELSLHKLYATAHWLDKNRAKWTHFGEEIVQEVSEKELSQISQLSTPQEVLLLMEIPENEAPDEPSVISGLNLALESIRDPGNLGTIIRLADWYGLSHIYCSADCADAYNPKVVQASMGSIARVKVIYTDLPELLMECPLPSYAALLEGELNIHELKPAGDGALLLIGNESRGINHDLSVHCTYTLKIPSFGKAESLNAAIATGILLDNFRRLIG
jgi:TrmH family RNA methyltransferase